jgi:hypothetical protein
MKNLSLYLILMILFGSCSIDIPEQIALAYDDLPEEVDFNFHVRPILSDRCYSCHGPDEEARKAELRLDIEKEAKRVIKAGNINGSALVHRILSTDPEEAMPPAESNLMLTDKEKAILMKWIKQGATWKAHWSFTPPVASEPPVLQSEEWPVKNEIDRFVFKKHELTGLSPNSLAGKERLLRRVSLDLTGLPPTIQEIDAFLADQSADAFEKVVDRLLNSQASAERLAMDWMDLSRYADSHGMHADGWRMMWPWRDWVIKAFDQNMPYDQFVTWQLAGDLLPNASRDQKLATAFNRNHPMTAEGGVIDEEFRLNYVFDRTETVGTAFLGLTMNCSRCHDHKFDPISQKDYYQLTAFFNNIKELGMTGDDGNYGPMLPLMDGETEQILKQLESQITTTNQAMDSASEQLLKRSDLKIDYNNLKPAGRIGYYPLETIRNRTKSDLKDPGKQKGTIKGQVVDNNRDAYTPGVPELVPAKVGNGLKFKGAYDELYIDNIPNYEWTQEFSGGMWINSTKKEPDKTQTLMGTAGQKNNFWRGWDFYLDQSNRLNIRLIHSLPHNYLHAVTKDSIALNNWTHVFFTYNGSGKANGLKLYINGAQAATEIAYDQLYKTIKTINYGAHKPERRAIRVAKSYRAFTGEDGVFKGIIDEIELYESSLTSLEVMAIYQRNPDQELAEPELAAIERYHWVYNQPEMQQYRKVLKDLRNRWLETMNSVKEVMIMEEMPIPRTSYAYRRGAYDNPMYQVTAGTPETLGAFPEELPANRLGLAHWLFREDNPLTARVTVNRYWQMIFGNGLVRTPQDFGVQGALPSHPQLLDWLAVYFRDQNWDVKALLKLMVMSHTYQQSAKVDQQKWEIDPENVLLARGASYRLPAEMIRDNALAASGLLVDQVGGESVRPYQPEGLWIDKGNFSIKLLRYKVTPGDSLYRRSLYTFIKRTSPHPAMTAFDAPNRDVCTVKRENTNTPLQALVLMNDPQFVECARVLAARLQQEAGNALEDQIALGFRLVTGRKPKKEELEVFKDLYHIQFARFQKDSKAAEELLSVGEYPVDKNLPRSKTAALAVVASTMINHDEAYMKR